LLIIGKYEVQGWDDLWWHDVHTKLHENPSVGLEVMRGDMWGIMISLTRISS